MNPARFEQWLAHADELTDAQRDQVHAVRLERTEAAASRAAVERNLGEDRRCPHCHAPHAVGHGTARGGAATGVSGLPAHIQCHHGHTVARHAPQGTLAPVQPFARPRRVVATGGPPLWDPPQPRVPLADPVSGGGWAVKRGRSAELVPVLVATGR